MNNHICTVPSLHFPPCFTASQLHFAELLLFGMLPNLTKFTRDVTPFERAAGITDTAALVIKTPSGIERKYGTAILLN